MLPFWGHSLITHTFYVDPGEVSWKMSSFWSTRCFSHRHTQLCDCSRFNLHVGGSEQLDRFISNKCAGSFNNHSWLHPILLSLLLPLPWWPQWLIFKLDLSFCIVCFIASTLNSFQNNTVNKHSSKNKNIRRKQTRHLAGMELGFKTQSSKLQEQRLSALPCCL